MSRLPNLRRAERLAYRVLIARQITSLPVEPLPMLRACRDTEVMTCAEAAVRLEMPEERFASYFDRTDAVTFRAERNGEVRYCVVYRTGGNPARLRFTLAHELGHRLLGHTGLDEAEEREADHFASHLLCPEPVMQRLRTADGGLPEQLAARLCYVSHAFIRALAYRPSFLRGDALQQRIADQMKNAIPKGE